MTVTLHEGDCLDVLRTLPDASIDSVVTDPPYGISFMQRKWDYDLPSGDIWREVLRVLKPGGHLLCFGGTRTYHRAVVAIEDAGFEIRDCVMWITSTGFPKSHNLQGDWKGFGTSLKPAWEPICVARKPFTGGVAENVLQHGTGALNIDGCRVETNGETWSCKAAERNECLFIHDGAKDAATRADSMMRFRPNSESHPAGRWPANLIHDGSDEVLDTFAAYGKNQAGTAARFFKACPIDEGGHSRFHYSSKASKKDRAGSKHITVKPIALMAYLCRLVTPPGGIVLDPFAGSGTTGQAAINEGFSAILIEREPEYCADIRRRLLLEPGAIFTP